MKIYKREWWKKIFAKNEKKPKVNSLKDIQAIIEFFEEIDFNVKGLLPEFKKLEELEKEREVGTGKIINITSVTGLIGNAGQTNYAASKAGMIGFTKSLAKEVAKRGITANCIAPGYIKTSMTEKLPEKIKNEILKQIPIGRIGLPSDIAQTAVFLASNMSDYITGQVITVDGGMVM